VDGDIHTTQTIRTPQIDFDDGTSMTTAPLNGTNGTDGLGFTGGSYNATTGVVTFTSNDGLGFSTGDLRGADGADGVDGTNGTNGADGADGTNGTNGLGFTGGNYNSTTGVVTFTSNDGLGFSTGDLRPFTPSYFKINFLIDSAARLSFNAEPGDQGSFLNTSSVPLNVGGYGVAINQITIPADGVYELSYAMIVQSEGSGADRKVRPTYIRVNNTDPDGVQQAISSCYLRFRYPTTPCWGTQGASTILSLNQNDLISIWSYQHGSAGGHVHINHGHLTIKRIA